MPSLVVEALANVVVGELGGLEEGDLEALMGKGRGCRATSGAAANGHDEDLGVCRLEGRVSVHVGTGEPLTIECIFVLAWVTSCRHSQR